MSSEFYERPMVVRIRKIFGDPIRPSRVTQQQFDDAQDDLIATASKQWHEIDQSDYWHYLLDLCYVNLQQDLFDYLFPAFLIRWWEGQLNQQGGPESECDFYRAIDNGQVFTNMMTETRQKEVRQWMVDAYMEGVDAWSNQLSFAQNRDLHAPLWSFNALGQSVKVTQAILEELESVTTLGRAQWWLVFTTGIVWDANKCPAIPVWTPDSGGGGVYLTESAASIFDHGFLPENLQAIRDFLTYPRLLTLIDQVSDLLPVYPHGKWARTAWEECLAQPERIQLRLEKFFKNLGLPDLGGIENAFGR